MWSRDRIDKGWKWGAKRDDRKKLHPSLLAYGKLSDDDKQWDRDSARQTLAVIRALGYEIERGSSNAARRASQQGGSPKHAHAARKPVTSTSKSALGDSVSGVVDESAASGGPIAQAVPEVSRRCYLLSSARP